MPKGKVTKTIPASAQEVFALIHNYERRLEWDTLLQKADLEPEFPQTCVGAVSVCQGRAWLGGITLRTEYVSFQPAKVAAVKMLNRPPFFESFAASIRHRDIAENLSEIEYQYNFTARPTRLRWLLHPVMNAALKWETQKRLLSLKRYFANQVK